MNAAALSLTPGTRVERFSIEERIAVGSSSITYRAREAGTGSYFVLREFLPDSGVTRSTEGALQPEDEAAAQEFAVGMAQFLAGAARLATLHHPSIARISRWFKANGTAYLVMPWPPGSSLAARLGEGQALDAPATVALAMPLLDALDYLHGQGMIHQELAPQTVQLLDSGGAALLGPGAGTAVQAGAHTAAGDANAYAAIEQARAGGIIGPWTDIYGLSACFYHCITGHAPAPAADRHAAVLSGLPDPLVAITLPAGASQAQREISTLVGRGLALEPSARPQSVREWRARVAYSPEASETTDPAAGAAHAAEGREWLPIILLVLFLAGIAGMAWYLFTDRSNGTGAETPSSATTSARNAEEVERWRQALEANAVLTYREFMEDFPQSRHLQQAQEQIDALEDKAWEAIVAEGTKAAFEAHLEMFPQGRHVAEARARIEEFRLEEARLAREQEELKRKDDAAWNAARSAGTLAALDGYITAWPGGLHVAEAHDLRQKMQGGINDDADFGIAAAEHTIEAYRGYIGNYPSGRHVTAAQQAIESLTLRSGKTFQDCSECPLMVVVPPGAFWQGSAESSALAIGIEKPRFRVTIAAAFAIGVHEITMAQWDACAAEQGCATRPGDNGWGRGARPVMMVSWNDAGQYASWLSKKTGQAYSLPSESQWEYVARAGEESDWLGGDAAGICRYGNIAAGETDFEWRHTACADDSALATTPVG
ncbi:MAG TPA: SUMF1/EgtB/PvdO family nonheme iron enzyme, partial [Xanthomonadales bacterium]|nr:SUMF1/EgtB/PvdO family nonheme iron enzyme [Xanthomonadales bacterium]